MEEVKVTLAKCGMDCTECRFAIENDCPGCMQGRVFEDEECEVLECCVRKGCEHCGKCSAFPCDTLKAISYDTETGDGGARLLRLKELRDNELRKNRKNLFPAVSGGCMGIVIGTIIGGISGSFAPWIFAGMIFGAGLGTIIGIGRSTKQ